MQRRLLWWTLVTFLTSSCAVTDGVWGKTLMVTTSSTCTGNRARACRRLRARGEPCVFRTARNPVTWRRFGCMDESIDVQSLFSTSDCEGKSKRQCVRLFRFGVACKYFPQRDPKTNERFGCKTNEFDPARGLSIQDCYNASSRGACNNLVRIGISCAYYSRRHPLTGERYGCMEDGLCHVPNRQRSKCLQNDKCMFLSKSDVNGRRNTYGCVSKQFCDFRLERECKGFSHCQWDGAQQRCTLSTSSSKAFGDDQGKKPNLFIVVADDLGHADAGFGRDPRVEAEHITPEMTRLAKEGLILNRHYAHWHCSPSRRSILSGRLPIHTGEDLSNEFDDHMDERWTWISEKLKPAGYYNLFLGKGHIGFRYWSSMPINRGFDEHLGMLGGYSDYRARNRWRNDARYTSDNSYSTLFIGKKMEKAILSHFSEPNASPMFAYVAFQAPHSPMQCPGRAEKYRYFSSGWWPSNCMFRMIWAIDVEIGIMERTLKQVGQWNNSLIVVTSDSGGSRRHFQQIGNNYPFRGEKSTSFEGGIRAPTFLTGGFLPDSLRGRSSELVSHLADWYATFCHLAGVDPDDAPPSPPRHEGVTWDQVDDLLRPSLKSSGENVWGSNSYPNIDSVNLWPLLRQEAYEPVAKDAAHDVLIISSEVAIAGDYKLVTGQPCEISPLHTGPCIDQIMYNWVDKSDSWSDAPQASIPVAQRADRCLQVIDYREMATSGQILQPCLFYLGADLRETRNLVEDTATMENLWRRLNNSIVYQYSTRVPGLEQGLSYSTKPTCSYTFDASRLNIDYEPVCD